MQQGILLAAVKKPLCDSRSFCAAMGRMSMAIMGVGVCMSIEAELTVICSGSKERGSSEKTARCIDK
jgi:hypothetical protein